MKVCIIGLGYIGLPLAATIASKSTKVVGVDTNEEIVNLITMGKVHINEPKLDILVKAAVNKGYLKAKKSPEEANIFVICVPTPFTDNYQPNLTYVKSAVLSIIPYLIAILCAIALFRASGALDGILNAVRWLVLTAGLSVTEWVDALPVAFMKPLSGGGARGAYVEVMSNFGIGSLQELIAATMQGSTETTFYVLAVYFGSVGIKKTRYAVTAGLFADLIGIIAAIIVSYIFFT